MAVNRFLTQGGFIDTTFINPSVQEMATGRVLVAGNLVMPAAHKTDEDVVNAYAELKAEQTAGGITAEREDELAQKAYAALQRLPDRFKNHQVLHHIEFRAYPILESALNGTEMARRQDLDYGEPGQDTRELKHYRKIARDGSLIHAVATSHMEVTLEIAVHGVVYNPLVRRRLAPGWICYTPGHVAYVVRLLNDSTPKLRTYTDKRAALGLGSIDDEVEATGDLCEMLDGWKQTT